MSRSVGLLADEERQVPEGPPREGGNVVQDRDVPNATPPDSPIPQASDDLSDDKDRNVPQIDSSQPISKAQMSDELLVPGTPKKPSGENVASKNVARSPTS